MSDLTVSIVITTLNRCQDLQETLHEIGKLSPAPDEIIVYLDGCTDGSEDMVRYCFPHINLIVAPVSQGSVPARDTAFRQARGDLIVSLDDDSYPLQLDFVDRLRMLAGMHPEAGAFAFHEIRPEGPMPHLSRSHEPRKAWIAAYPNCAGAIRRQIYGTLTSYPRFFSHMYEEPDFCLQVYDSGYGVLYAPGIIVLHRYTHVLRNMKARHHRNARNELWSVVMRCPTPFVFLVALYRIIRQFFYGAMQGWDWLIEEPRWILDAFRGIRLPLENRSPATWSVYWRWMRMARNPITGDKSSLFGAFPHIAKRASEEGSY